jgi:hypothetical protein
MPKRIAVFKMDAGFRPIFFVIVSKSIVFAISISARSDAIDWPKYGNLDAIKISRLSGRFRRSAWRLQGRLHRIAIAGERDRQLSCPSAHRRLATLHSLRDFHQAEARSR